MSANLALLPKTYAGRELVLVVCEAPSSAKESNSHSASSAERRRCAKVFLTVEVLTNLGSEFAIGRVSC
jgi:hypothetical protein